MEKICTNGEFVQLNLTSWIRIRISNTDPEPGGDLHKNQPGYGSETLLKRTKKCIKNTHHIYEILNFGPPGNNNIGLWKNAPQSGVPVKAAKVPALKQIGTK